MNREERRRLARVDRRYREAQRLLAIYDRMPDDPNAETPEGQSRIEAAESLRRAMREREAEVEAKRAPLDPIIPPATLDDGQ